MRHSILIFLAIALYGCGSGISTQTEIHDVTVTIPVPAREDSTLADFPEYPYYSPGPDWPSTGPLLIGQTPDWTVTWDPSPHPAEAYQDSIRKLRRQVEGGLSAIRHLQGDIGQLKLSMKPTTATTTIPDTTVFTKPPDIIETPFMAKVGLVLGGIVVGVIGLALGVWAWKNWRKNGAK